MEDPAGGPGVRMRICFVCTGNICRSPMAAVVFGALVARSGLGGAVEVSSAGTGDWHVGERADQRTLVSLESRGYDGTAHRARQFEPADWVTNDLIVALDSSHERVLRASAPSAEDRAKVELLLAYDRKGAGTRDVPDPYYSDQAAFDRVLETIERACRELFRQIEPAIRQGERTS